MPSITIGTGENVINVVYVKDSFGYTVNYYKDSISEGNFIKAETGTAEYESTVTADVTINIPEGYKFTGTVPSITIGTGENVINVVYVKRTDLTYTVRYFYNGIEAEKIRLVKGDQKVGNQITESDIIQKATYNNEVYTLQKYTTEQGNKQLPLTIGTNVALNVINVYYVRPIINATKTSQAYTAEGLKIDGTNIHEKDEIEYEISVYNRGLGVAEGLNITDTIDLTKLEILKITINNQEQTIPSNGIVSWNGNLSESSQMKIVIRVKVKDLPQDSNGIKIEKNKVYLMNKPIEDTNEYTVLKSNIHTEKISKAYTESGTEITNRKLHPKDTIEYTIKVWNIGNEGIDVKITDEAPEGTVYKSGESSKTIFVPANTAYENAKSITFTVEVKEEAIGTKIKNIATVEENDGDTTNPTDPTEYEVVGAAKIILSKSSNIDKNDGSIPTVEYGDIIEYKITARNDGGETGTAIIKDEDLKKAIDDGKVELKEITSGEITLKELTEDGINVTVEPNSAKTIIFKVKVIANVKTEIINTATATGTENGKTEEVKAKVEKTVEITENKENTKITGTNIVLVLDNSDSMEFDAYIATNQVCNKHSTSLGHEFGHCKKINGVWYKTEARNRLKVAKEVTNRFIDMIDLPET